jgi:hypothetical protein
MDKWTVVHLDNGILFRATEIWANQAIRRHGETLKIHY